MDTVDETVQVTLMLPRELYVRASEAAAHERRQLGDLLGALVAEGLDAHTTVRELLERVSSRYRARLAHEGKLNQSSEEVLEELRDLREQIAGELYP